jgi:transglutaminase-like putative cysteine protease
VLSWKVKAPGNLRPWIDGFGNAAHVLVVEGPHREVRVKAVGEVEIADVGKPLLADADPHLPELFLRWTRLTAPDDRIIRFAGGFRPALATNARKGLDSLLAGIRQSIDGEGDSGPDQPVVTASQALDRHKGGSRDQSHLFVSCCRSLGVPARYVSGYLCQDSTEDAGLSTHAWAEAWVEGAGWLRYDVANRMSNAKAHVRVAVGLDYLDTVPVRGLRRGAGNETLAVETTITDARPIKVQQQQQQQ